MVHYSSLPQFRVSNVSSTWLSPPTPVLCISLSITAATINRLVTSPSVHEWRRRIIRKHTCPCMPVAINRRAIQVLGVSPTRSVVGKLGPEFGSGHVGTKLKRNNLKLFFKLKLFIFFMIRYSYYSLYL